MIRAGLLACVLLLAPSALAGVAGGQAAPALSHPNLPQDGGQTSLESLRGKVVYLDFWASWCGPCRLSFPQLEKLRTELGPRGFEVLAVNVDENLDDALAFLASLPVSYPVVWDPEGESPAGWGILGMPTGYLIDRQGMVRLVHQGFRKGDGERLREEVLQLLGDNQ